MSAQKVMQQQIAMQDGGQFYDHTTGAIVEDYGDTGSFERAQMLRVQFLAAHPGYRMATTEELFGGAQP
jgi:hypothetical protein